MSDNLPVSPAPEPIPPALTRMGGVPAHGDEWGEYGETPAGPGLSIGRVVMAVRRYWWLLLLAALLGAGGAMVAYRVVVPLYTARASLLVMTPTREAATTGAVQATALMEEASLLDLLRAPLVTERVVMGERLYLLPPGGAERVFETFALDSMFVPGRYVLELPGGPNGGWRLRTRDGQELERGRLGESLGESRGFLWRIAPTVDTAGEFPFTVIPPREAADQLAERLQASLNRQGNFITVSLEDRDPARAARILNGLIRSFERSADSLKAAGLQQSLEDVEVQAEQVQASLRQAREDLQAYQMQIITRPSDRGVPVGAGLQETRAPIVARFEEIGADKEAVDLDRERIQRVLAAIPDSGVSITQLELIPSVASSSELSTLLQELAEKRVERRDLAQVGTENYPPLVRLDAAIAELERVEIPRLLRGVQMGLEQRSRDLGARRDSLAAEMVAIPVRMSREDALRQEVADQEALATEVGRRREMQRLIFRSSLEDFQVLNDATVPFTPSSDQRLPLAGAVFLGFLGAGLAGAVLLDRFDGRFRYPEDLTHRVGVEVLGMIPRIRGRKTRAEVEEAFRDLRMRLMYAHGAAGPLMVVVTSPGPSEGKTLVSANLGLAFSKIGRRTLLVDGDTRRGDLHRLIGGERTPGLVDFLAGTSDGRVIHRTEYDNLHFMGSGTRMARAPELLAGERIRRLFQHLRERYDVVLVDGPPMAVGADAFHLASLTGSMALVVRAGASDKSVVERKLQALGNLPVRILGGILNDVASSALKGYGYYSYYVPGYEAGEEHDAGDPPALPAGTAGDVVVPD
ncbi:MAG: polysaccharide biosynthesis tyrosine autokinase [Longimicrobiales bacterium]|nr:polysaccharide biosynthesis tyrosine autokinase [Longimicrobiales bacterium]